MPPAATASSFVRCAMQYRLWLVTAGVRLAEIRENVTARDGGARDSSPLPDVMVAFLQDTVRV